MTIKIYNNKIQFGDYTLAESVNGFTFDGTITANSIIDGFQGTTSGFTSGGFVPPATLHNVIDKFPFTSNSNATDVGDLSVTRYSSAGHSSKINGYIAGGIQPPATTYSNVIDKFPFSVAFVTGTDVGDLTLARYGASGQSSSISGYSSGGFAPPTPTTTRNNTVDKFTFATDDNATDVGDLTVARADSTGQSSSTHGYTSGGSTIPANVNVIDKFPFASDANATDVGDLTVARNAVSGQSSNTDGYTSGGDAPLYLTIDKFPFASNSNATDVGDVTVLLANGAGQSSFSHGYNSGGQAPRNNVIDKFPFAVNSNATDVGDLTVSRGYVSGQQV